MQPLDRSIRARLEKTVKEARDVAEIAARAALEQFGVGAGTIFADLSDAQRNLRRKLRAHGRQLGDHRHPATGEQEIGRLTEEVAYEHWHRMLFARFLAENSLLIYPDPDGPLPITLAECEELAAGEGARNGWELAGRYAARMLPQIFRADSPVFELVLPPEHQQSLERMLAELPPQVFTASDSLGWVYQFWQAKKKDEVNKSEVKIGARELPAVTQLFTEPYMVSFLLDNSLGAWWAARRLTEADLQNAGSEEELRRKAAIPGVPLEYLRFVKVTRASSSGIETPDKVARASSSGIETPDKVARASSSGFTTPDQDGLATMIGIDQQSLSITHGENVPHWTCDRAVYHVSFRLSDAIPLEKRDEWLREREDIRERARRAQRELTPDEEKRLQHLYSERVEKYLDAGYGACHLANPHIAEIVSGAFRHFNGVRYRLHAWSVMPNHVHVIVEPVAGFDLSGIIHSWKSYSANEANKRLGRSGSFWQEDAYNHIIRTEQEYQFQIRYTWENSDKAGLENWQWRWIVARASSSGFKTPDQDGLATMFETPDQDGLATMFETPDQDGLATSEATGETVWTPAAGTFDSWPQHLSELKSLDPCCGSGHFLVAALLMLVPMRMELEGLDTRTAVDAVLRENIHGLELDQRCVEIAAFALALTAWKYPDAGGYRPLPALHLACSGLSVSAAKEEWKQLGLGRNNLALALDWLHDTFREAPVLGSLLNPARSDAARMVRWDELSGALDQALRQEQTEERREAAVVAQGLAKAATLLAGQYQLVITNVPYLHRGKQGEPLRNHIEKHHPEGKSDLATAFLDRCLQLCVQGGSAGIVLPQNWLFLTSYRKFREKLLKNDTWHLIARMGEGGFESTAAAGAFTILFTLSRGSGSGLRAGLFEDADAGNLIRGLDVSAPRTAAEKAAQLLTAEIQSVEQARQLENPDARVVIDEEESAELLARIAHGVHGFGSKDSPRYFCQYWEITCPNKDWQTMLTTVDNQVYFGGKQQIVFWQQGKGILADLGKMGLAIPAGEMAWGKWGVAVSQMRALPATLHTGEIFDKNVAVILPNNPAHLTAIWCFCSSPEYHEAVRRIDQSLKVTNATLVKVPFDLALWTRVAAEQYPHGLPKPYSDDPTQWIFHGHPCGSVIWDEQVKWTVEGPLRHDETVLQVAVARLLGYRWPAEVARASSSGSHAPDQDDLATKLRGQDVARASSSGQDVARASSSGIRTPDQDGLATVATMELADEQRAWVDRCAALQPFADDDGIVCIPSVLSEVPAADRLLRLLAAAYGDAWSADTLAKLLTAAGHAGKTLETWLREKFFAQHCKLFHDRPFIWHVWDGQRDGFAALVNYHKLDHKLLEALIYTYLGDWITRLKVARASSSGQDVARASSSGQDVARASSSGFTTPDQDDLATKLAAAEGLKSRLELILEGEQPYDIFVRWKPLEQQPIGWNPDLNDGVRLNIRPFLTVPDVGKKGAGVLREKPNIKWDKDRGKDVPSAPWYHLGPEYGGNEGDRINDHHLSLEEKRNAREAAK